MIRVLIALAALFAVVFALDWLGGVPIDVNVVWPGGEMAPSLRVVVVALVVFAILAVVLWSLVMGLIRGPRMIGDYFRARRRDKGYGALSRGMIAVGSGDARLAHRYSSEARKQLGDREPLVHLLEAQTAQLEGRNDRARAAFNRMLEKPDTALLGLRGLYVEAVREGETAAARHYAAEALKLSPGILWAGTATIEYQSAEKDWVGALETLEASASARLVDKKTARRQRAVILTARALQSEDHDPDLARNLSKEAHRLAPDLVPAAVIAGRMLSRANELRKASKVLETTWRESPHPDIAEVYAHVRSGDAPRDRLKRVKHLASLRPNHVEGTLAIARQAIDAHDWAEARSTLTQALRQSPTRRVCLMMAELEEAEHGDRGRMREWLSRAVHAPRDATWVADGVTADEWSPVSPVTGHLDAFEWKVPATAAKPSHDLDGAELAHQAMLPLDALPPAAPPRRRVRTTTFRRPRPVRPRAMPRAAAPRRRPQSRPKGRLAKGRLARRSRST
ncbi:heme biosynthesis protein HemY [Methylobrevis pamukkalensis]|uniref:Tetratricopeptide repeat protein n=1 Tax=Methylobrevis pamukkalensis TaxID=1439726 RepID=A0A1E3H270_9HYPH|nr:heme biosynthesis HemY N-terminal domain-containing protein [Methylobrevis pamukkalensis]ODN70400.1 tetratricopeptide repeat protein [Methylobrevis pamukkalensis]